VLYELSSGVAPYDGAELGELLAAILEREPPPLGSRRAELPPDFCDIVHRCLAKNRDWRFQSVAELAAALAPYAGEDGHILAERVRKALTTSADSKARSAPADASGSLPAVARATGSGAHSAPSPHVSSDARPDGPAALAVPPEAAPIVATTGTALTHSAAQRIGKRRSVAWLAGGAGLLCGVGIAMTVAISARHRVAPPVASGGSVASSLPVAAAPASVAPLPDEQPASPAESAAPAPVPPPAPVASASHAPSVASAANGTAPRPSPPTRVRQPPRPAGKPTGLSTSRD
jgi:serine/threonine-protein kinase